MNKILRQTLAASLLLLLATTQVVAKSFYVTATASAQGDGSSWDSPMTLENALDAAVAGDDIYLMGYSSINGKDLMYRPSTKAGFKLKSGVRLHGGCKGGSGAAIERPTAGGSFKMQYQSALVADIGYNDVVPSDLLIFPANSTRSDNAYHVLTMDLGVSEDNKNENNTTTLVEGITFAAGSAAGSGSNAFGGGIYVTNSTSDQNANSRAYQISNCFFVNNYALQGGAIYVDANVKSTKLCTISHSSFFNNAAGTRSGSKNMGGAIWVAGVGTVHNSVIYNNVNGAIRLSDNAKVVNCTVVHNTISAIDLEDGKSATSNGGGSVYNTLVWGNSSLDKKSTKPNFEYCAYPEVVVTNTQEGTDAEHNVKISYQNFDGENAAAWLSTPTSNIGYDRSFNNMQSTYPQYSFELEVQSALLGKGSTQEAYQSWTGNTTSASLDLAGDTRYHNGRVDIGAYERERLGKGRHLYVKSDGKPDAKGTSWDDAMPNLQTAINNLYGDGKQGKGEIWVAAGTYSPDTYVDNATNAPRAFQMKDGISVIGGFKGNENSISERKTKDMKWQFGEGEEKYETILQGAAYSPTQRWTETNGWSINSSSYHVVWFAPSPGAASFQYQTILDGVTIQGGSSEQNSINENYAPYKGAGVYMNDGNAILRNCVVRYNSAGQTRTGSQGGGIYCQGGQVRYSLVYNNSAESGGGVYLETAGFINNSMITNNSAKNGAGVYLKQSDTYPISLYQVLATSVVSNNTSTQNAAVYVDGSGLVEQNTIVNNVTANTIDESATNSSPRTGGLYVTKECTAINNLIWNNSLTVSQSSASANRKSSSYAQVYAGTSATKNTALFYNNGISDFNAATWNNITQQGTYEMPTDYASLAFDPGEGYTIEDYIDYIGVHSTVTDIFYYWQTKRGSVLRGRGMLYSELPQDVIFKPSTDFLERNFESKPPIGAFLAEAYDYVFEENKTSNSLRLYFNHDSESLSGNGSSWAEGINSLSDMLSNLGNLQVGDEISYLTATGGIGKRSLKSTDKFEICIREGNLTPKTPYTFQENEAKAKTYTIPATVVPLTLLGGYPAESKVASPTDADRNAKTYRTEFDGNDDGTALSDGVYHLFRAEAGANVTLDGIVISHGYAAGTADQPTGGALLIGSTDESDAETHVTLRNCILENNTATDGSAIGMTDDAKNVKLRLENCVINNNTCLSDLDLNSQDIFYMGDSSNKLSLDHVSIVNNIGAAPSDIGTSSFAAGNKVNLKSLAVEGANNTIDIATLGAEGAKNFSNPTREVGAKLNANVYYGGNAEFRPITSSENTGIIINQAKESADYTLTTDLNGEERTLGGAPDLGAYEALLPKAGRVIYVRSYNTAWLGKNEKNDRIDGTPDFNLLKENEGKEYDGTTWDRAIMGNAICNVNKDRTANDFYVTEDGKLLPATIDFTKYSNDYNADTAPYGQQSNAYGAFFMGGTSGVDNGNQSWAWDSEWKSYNKVSNNRDETFVSGLQYAVEKAAAWNAAHPSDSMEVWVGAGVYTDYKGFVIRDGVKVYGGFKKDGNPGESDRHPLFSQYVPARKEYADDKASDYETILQVRKESPVYMTNNEKELWWGEHKASAGSLDGFADDLIQATKTTRHYVLYQPDACVPTWGVSGNDKDSRVSSNEYRYAGSKYPDTKYYKEYTKGKVKWDGFTIRHGYTTHYTTNRDGGGGVRVFRGIELENLIIVNNMSHGERSRGGGLYMDGDNSVISNSYLLQNFCWGWNDNYGGGAYMIQGTGFNMVVASNRSRSQGGGIFIENAKFYNNTVAYNMSENGQGTGIMHWQDNTTGIQSSLTLYNCLVYNNMKNGGKVDGTTSIGSSATNLFNPAKNCYVSGSVNAADKFKESDGNITGEKAVFPFAVTGYETKNDIRFHKARLQNDFRLNEADGLAGNPCLNGGTQNVGDGVKLPDTDMDYTNRVKDCEIDIGAYEADNTANITAQEVMNVEDTENHAGVTDYVFYVTQNGAGTRSGNSPANAACADKLQSVLTKAGELAKSVNDNFSSVTNTSNNDNLHKVYVKVAGYEIGDDGSQFVYHANTLADSSDPQSYTFLIPDGVWLMGGYNEGTYQNGVPVGDGNWNDNQRNVTIYKTILSAKTEPKEGSTVSQEINGYHTVSFGKWPTGEIVEYNKNALMYRATIDGVYITDGLATDNAGFKAMGGGAVVPRRAHMRNCILANNQAIKGGALMLLEGGMVSGSLLHANTAEQGGAIYAANGEHTDGTGNYHAYMASCTVAENTANAGGGIYQELGALMAGNSVIWGNEAPIDKNISGVLDQQFTDVMQALANGNQQTTFYPYNYCFVERYDVPANTWNVKLESDANLYFTNDIEFYPRPYSILVEQGVESSYQQAWLSMGVQAWDLYGQDRNESKNLTAGCYALTLPTISTDKLLTTLYVSQNGGANISDEDKAKYLGRSFYTPFNSVDAALSYIKEARSKNIGNATDETTFNIFVSEGTYKPSVAREQNKDDAGQAGAINTDRRMQSFEIPVNVNIFGSFYHEDKTFSNYANATGTDKETQLTLTETDGNKITLTEGGSIEEMLQKRNTNWMADNNLNGLIEPWEFAYSTYFSGDIKASSTERKVYHVVYSEIKDSALSSAEKSNDVLLDGITIMNGETQDYIDYKDDNSGKVMINEVGHGGGIYSKNVSYTLNRCRILNNIAVHGAGVYVRNGSLDIINSLFAGNWAGSENEEADVEAGHGGAVCASFESARKGNLHAVNSIFANNTAYKSNSGFSYGGAIFVERAEDMTQTIWKGDADNKPYRDVEITNCIIANNNASINGGVHVSVGDDLEGYINNTNLPKQILNNSILWNNEHTYRFAQELGTDYMNHCAYNFKAKKATSDGTRASTGNILLSEDNKAANGPRFSSPTTVVGKEGYNIGAQWNPAAISVLTDAGDGNIDYTEETAGKEDGEYKSWWDKHSERLTKYGYLTDYIRYATTSEMADSKASDAYTRYMGAMDADGNVTNKRIDIGVYEFQYKFTTTDNEAMYVGTEDKGLADGSNWDNQTSDLRGAIIAMSHPTGNKDSKVSNHRKVYVKGGEYYSPNTELADAFTLNVDNTKAHRQFIESIEIVGACTGLKKNTSDNAYRAQDFSNPTVLVCNPHKEDATQSLLDITTNGKPVTISGFTFKNTSIDEKDERGYGITAAINNITNATDGQAGKLTLANCAFLQNKNDGLYIKENTAQGALIYNSLFADGDKNGITAVGKVDITNATFVNNAGKAIDNSANGTIDIVNSVAWKNAGGNHFNTDRDGKHNIAFADNVDNGDVMNGPNFADPSNEEVSLRDYTIRPSLYMLNQGDNTLYNNKVGANAATNDNDLQNLSRVIGDKIDIGAYECNSDLLPIIYVNTTLATPGNGKSWQTATNDMQSAINLAELYANTDAKEGKAYVFVNHASSASDISITLPGVYVYGGMGTETADELNADKSNIKNIVETLLTKRKGTIEQSTLSTINGLTMTASVTSNNSNASVVDGFLINGNINLQNGYLSSSVLGENSEVTGSENGVLYNSLNFGKVSNVKAVNVTAVKSSTEGSGTLPAVEGAANNRTAVSSPNRYLNKDVNYWSYQLEETDKAKGLIDANENETATQDCMTAVGHKRDLAGNKRTRNGVDKGCFETWYLTQTTKATKDDYPHGKSVIYIAGEDDQKTEDPITKHPFHELILEKDLVRNIGYSTFSPGFVLLGHHAGLRGMGNSIKLDNFAVERELRKPYNDICVMPFTVINREVVTDKVVTQDISAGFIAHRYSGAERANYNHKFDSTNSSAWLEGIDTNQAASDGMMLSLTDKADDKMTLRFYGKSYEETDTIQTKARLYQNNNQQPWSDANGSTKFTAKENMGWNLIGSPYLCAMNYSDLEYGRVIYPYNSLENKFDAGINTYAVTSEEKDGFIPAFDAVFTQTATLEDYEYFAVKHDSLLTTLGDAYQPASSNARIALSRKGESIAQAADATSKTSASTDSDEVYFNAVATSKAKNDFDMGSDGVKIMTSTVPQLYIEQNGGRYSLLSAVNIEGSLSIGVSVPTAGEYSLSIPEDCDVSKYETIWLKDKQTGKGIDLLEGNYDFVVSEAGEQNGRFTISFNRMAEDKLSEVSISSHERGGISITGLQTDDHICVYAASGTQIATQAASSSTENIQVSMSGVVIVEVTRAGKQVAIRKIAVK